MILQSGKKPEEIARGDIDRMLDLSGWEVQDLNEMNLGASPGDAVREVHMKAGFSDYIIFVERQAVGVTEAKPKSFTLSGVAEQSEKYAKSNLANLLAIKEPLPPLNEQKRIVEKVEQFMGLCDELESKLRKEREDSEKLMETVVRGLLEGAATEI